MDGYADSLESAIYLLRYLDDREAAALGRRADGRALRLPDGRRLGHRREHRRQLRPDRHALRPLAAPRAPGSSRGLRPWRLARHQTAPACRSTSTQAPHGLGTLLFDTPRHQSYLGLDVDYPRLNQWQEWWAAEPGHQYAVSLPDGSVSQMTGEAARGWPAVDARARNGLAAPRLWRVRQLPSFSPRAEHPAGPSSSPWAVVVPGHRCRSGSHPPCWG